MDLEYRKVSYEDYDEIYALWNQTDETRRALNPIDDSREGFFRYLKRNPDTCFVAVRKDRIIGVILAGHDGRRGIIHHLCVDSDHRRKGVAAHLLSHAEDALKNEGIFKIFELVFKDNDPANAFWEEQGYSIRTNINYRNKSLNPDIPKGE
ncbi:MAG: GNAT family N-acetyltransferase [Erysipelotrichaceae bacterium]|nr:GNAT family N-acetyltransferase [Erysipelotrichaceae bacterium]